jgi:hypothetical protein
MVVRIRHESSSRARDPVYADRNRVRMCRVAPRTQEKTPTGPSRWGVLLPPGIGTSVDRPKLRAYRYGSD